MKNFRMILIGCFLMMAACVKAQNISGKLVDEQNQPLVYANVVLQQTDSTFVKGETSDEKGSFRMTKVSAGDYRLVISSIGYETLYIDLQGFNQYAGYTDEYHIDDVARMLLVTASWNFSFGRDYKSKNKRMNNSDSDSGVM